MPSFATLRPVPYTARQMFDVVADVERYPEFLPLCESLQVRSRRLEGERTILTAAMGVGYKAIRENFTTRVTLDPAQLTILVEYLDGPFRYLENRWRFRPVEGAGDVSPAASVIDFYIRYEFRSRPLGMLVGGLFDRAFRKFAEAFERRADAVYRGVKAVAARMQ